MKQRNKDIEHTTENQKIKNQAQQHSFFSRNGNKESNTGGGGLVALYAKEFLLDDLEFLNDR